MGSGGGPFKPEKPALFARFSHILDTIKYGFGIIKTALLSLLFLALCLAFAIGYQMVHKYRTDFYRDGVVATATIHSIEGTHWQRTRKRRRRVQLYYHYRILLNGELLRFQWTDKYDVGEEIGVMYLPGKPSSLKTLKSVKWEKKYATTIYMIVGVAIPAVCAWFSFSFFKDLLALLRQRKKVPPSTRG